jgi:hypothetical protein
VAGPVIQATGKSTFEDGLRSGGSGSDFLNDHLMSAPNRLPVDFQTFFGYFHVFQGYDHVVLI